MPDYDDIEDYGDTSRFAPDGEGMLLEESDEKYEGSDDEASDTEGEHLAGTVPYIQLKGVQDEGVAPLNG